MNAALHSAGVDTPHETHHLFRYAANRPRLLIVIGAVVVLLFSVVGYRVLPQDEETPPLTQADIDRAVSRVTTQHLEPLETALSQTTTNLSQLHTRADNQQAALRHLKTEIATLMKQLSQLRTHDDWQQGLERTQQHWQSVQAALQRRVQRLETQSRQTKAKGSAPNPAAVPSAPPFQISAVEHWGDIPYVTVISDTGVDSSLRQGQTYAGWRLASVTSEHAVFINGTHTHKLPVGR